MTCPEPVALPKDHPPTELRQLARQLQSEPRTVLEQKLGPPLSATLERRQRWYTYRQKPLTIYIRYGPDQHPCSVLVSYATPLEVRLESWPPPPSHLPKTYEVALVSP